MNCVTIPLYGYGLRGCLSYRGFILSSILRHQHKLLLLVEIFGLPALLSDSDQDKLQVCFLLPDNELDIFLHLFSIEGPAVVFEIKTTITYSINSKLFNLKRQVFN